MLNLEQRLALLWVRDHQPAQWPPDCKDDKTPSHKAMIWLAREGLIRIWSRRQRFDPMSYELTEAGAKLLQPFGAP